MNSVNVSNLKFTAQHIIYVCGFYFSEYYIF